MELKKKVAPLRMSEEAYDAMLVSQGGRCAICGKLPGKIRLVRDHDHLTGRIRGLIHNRCNRSLAPFEWSDDVLRRLVVYIQAMLEDHLLYNAGLPPYNNRSTEE